MLFLSDQYAAATTAAQRAMYLAAGQAMLATFKVNNSTISDNRCSGLCVSGGGGIAYFGGSRDDRLEINGSDIINNVSTGLDGSGGIYSYGGYGNDVLSIDGSKISGNGVTGGPGGGILSFSDDTTINNSTISNNQTLYPVQDDSGWSGNGGGVAFATSRPPSGTEKATVFNTTISGNTAGGSGGGGGGIYSEAATKITNVTISGNTAVGAFGGGIYQNAVHNQSAHLALAHATLADNSGTNAANILNSGAAVTLQGTIITNGILGVNCSNKSTSTGVGTMTSKGNNLDSGDSCGFDEPTDLTNTDPLLESLADNGGPTKTHALRAGSPAIDAGGDYCPPADQRGVARMHDGNGDGAALADIGAFELRVRPHGTSEGGRTGAPSRSC
jgi:hypothetical protein